MVSAARGHGIVSTRRNGDGVRLSSSFFNIKTQICFSDLSSSLIVSPLKSHGLLDLECCFSHRLGPVLMPLLLCLRHCASDYSACVSSFVSGSISPPLPHYTDYRCFEKPVMRESMKKTDVVKIVYVRTSLTTGCVGVECTI
ncbi:hypothetical protein DY000_02042355 [Brassica cretica]|uniref:Uncharacterized protein n=1 Tax=Brassica cretica TaxID=69181 RepID=A0ABQ7BK20_BRACR|nr:hypothetical protein DY000_02042355 [Brassica cretica]